MNLFLKETRNLIKKYERNLLYLLARGNTILEFCLSAENICKGNKNDLQNIRLKKATKELKKISDILDETYKVLKDYNSPQK